MVEYNIVKHKLWRITINATINKKIIGYLDYEPCGETNKVYWIEVNKEFRNQKIASELVKILEKNSNEIIINSINMNAKEFWQKQGYQININKENYVTGYKKILTPLLS